MREQIDFSPTPQFRQFIDGLPTLEGAEAIIHGVVIDLHPVWKWIVLADNGAFGGYVDFVVTKNVNGGPTCTLTSFTGPGSNLGSFSEVNTDKLTFAFARGDQAGTPFALSGKEKAKGLIQQITLNQLTTQLSVARPLR